MTPKEKFEDIDMSKLPSAATEKLGIVKPYLFDKKYQTEEYKEDRADAAEKMNTLYGLIAQKYPESIKSKVAKAPEPKTPTAMAKQAAQQTVKQPRGKSTKATAGPTKRGNITQLAKEIRKEGESWNDARKRAAAMINSQKKVVVKKANKQYQKLKAYLAKHPIRKGATDVERDAPRKALPIGKRTAKKSGKTYYEYRENRTDRRRSGYPYLALGGKLHGAGMFAKGGELMGGQPSSKPKPSGAILLEVLKRGKEIIVSEDGGKTKELYVKNNNFSGYTLRYNGNQYEFVHSLAKGGNTGKRLLMYFYFNAKDLNISTLSPLLEKYTKDWEMYDDKYRLVRAYVKESEAKDLKNELNSYGAVNDITTEKAPDRYAYEGGIRHYAKGGNTGIGHYEVDGKIFIDYMEAADYCDKHKMPYSKIVKKKSYAKGGMMDDYTKSFGLVKVKFANPKYNYETSVSGDISESAARKYFVGKMFDVGVYPNENMQKVIDIEFHPKGSYAKGGMIEMEIEQIYSKTNFINNDFNWRLKLLEMLQDNSIEAYNIYQKLTPMQKQEVLQEQFEMDNDMGSYGDGDINTSKENLDMMLQDAKNGKRYAKGGELPSFIDVNLYYDSDGNEILLDCDRIAYDFEEKLEEIGCHIDCTITSDEEYVDGNGIGGEKMINVYHDEDGTINYDDMAEDLEEKLREYDDSIRVRCREKKSFAKGGEFGEDFGYHVIENEVTLKDGRKLYLTKGRYYWSNELGDGRPSGIYYVTKDGEFISKDMINFPIYAKGGKMGFKGLSAKVAARYNGKSVPAKYRKEYGTTYDKAEAKEVGNKVAAKVYRQQLAKK